MKAKPVLSFGSLSSPLAKAQTECLIDMVQRHHRRLTCQMAVIPSPDSEERHQRKPFLAATAAEVDFLLEKLLADDFRVLVIRAVDLAAPLPENVACAAVPSRRVPFDALLNRQGDIADDLDEDATVGVLNQRSWVQMRALWPELTIRRLEGGFDDALETLLRRCDVDALVVPAAAAEDMKLQGIVSEIFFPEMMLPGVGQGTLVVLTRADDAEAIELLAPLHSEATAAELAAETAFMKHIASDEDLPVSILARVTNQRISVTGAIGSVHRLDSVNRSTLEGAIDDAAKLGAELASSLLVTGSVFDILEADFPDGLPDESDEDREDLGELDELDDLEAESGTLPEAARLEDFPDDFDDDLSIPEVE